MVDKLARIAAVKKELKNKKALPLWRYQEAIINLQRIVSDPKVRWLDSYGASEKTLPMLDSFSWGSTKQEHHYWSGLNAYL